MHFMLYLTARGKIRCEKYKALDDLMVAYEGVRIKYQPAWAYDSAGALLVGAEPDGFERPGLRTETLVDRPTVASAATGG
jgi:hypothetical protein